MKGVRIYLLFFLQFMCFVNMEAQNISEAVRDSIWLFEAEPYEAKNEICILYYDVIRDSLIYGIDTDIDTYCENKDNLRFSLFTIRIFSSNIFYHLLVIKNGKYLIVNMRRPLEEIIVLVDEFMPSKKMSPNERRLLWRHVVHLYNRDQKILNPIGFDRSYVPFFE